MLVWAVLTLRFSDIAVDLGNLGVSFFVVFGDFFGFVNWKFEIVDCQWILIW